MSGNIKRHLLPVDRGEIELAEIILSSSKTGSTT
jgi:hypothetical protein